MENITNIKFYLEFAGAVLLAIGSLILIIKIIFKKADKNKNGKIELEEITNADIEFAKNLLMESFKTIAQGIFKHTGITGKEAYGLTITTLKKSKTVFDETEKGGEENAQN